MGKVNYVYIINKAKNATLVYNEDGSKKKKAIALMNDKKNIYNIVSNKIIKVPQKVADAAIEANDQIEIINN